jgi:hypothetical protein
VPRSVIVMFWVTGSAFFGGFIGTVVILKPDHDFKLARLKMLAALFVGLSLGLIAMTFYIWLWRRGVSRRFKGMA